MFPLEGGFHGNSACTTIIHAWQITEKAWKIDSYISVRNSICGKRKKNMLQSLYETLILKKNVCNIQNLIINW